MQPIDPTYLTLISAWPGTNPSKQLLPLYQTSNQLFQRTHQPLTVSNLVRVAVTSIPTTGAYISIYH